MQTTTYQITGIQWQRVFISQPIFINIITRLPANVGHWRHLLVCLHAILRVVLAAVWQCMETVESRLEFVQTSFRHQRSVGIDRKVVIDFRFYWYYVWVFICGRSYVCKYRIGYKITDDFIKIKIIIK